MLALARPWSFRAHLDAAGQAASWNRFLDTPPPMIRMNGWLFYRLGAKGFLHRGYNYWQAIELEVNVDPDTCAAAWPGIPYGDPLVVYPGEDGPIDSIRWEVFAESLQDYVVLEAAGIRPDDPMLAPIRGYADFPRSEAWINEALRKALGRGRR
jgi:hypothetical protein